MKANELMIGDWVCTEHDATPRQIDWIRTGEVGLLWNKVVTPPYLVPIPLTLEILEKNFGSALNGCYFEGDEFYELMIHEVNDGTWIIKHDNIEFSNVPRQQVMVSYVHELQHALRICGIEKEIDLC